MSLGLRDGRRRRRREEEEGGWRGVELEQGGGGGWGWEETGMVWQMCIQIYHASSGSEWSERERERERGRDGEKVERVKHIEWFRIHLKPVGLEKGIHAEKWLEHFHKDSAWTIAHVWKIRPLKPKQHSSFLFFLFSFNANWTLRSTAAHKRNFTDTPWSQTKGRLEIERVNGRRGLAI